MTSLVRPGSAPCFIATPDDAAAAGVVVVHEGNGISRQLLRVCQRLASAGYVTAAPDLFWRSGGSGALPPDEQRALFERPEAYVDIDVAAAAIRALGAQRVGVVGFCMGGTIAYEVACRPDTGLACAVSFYGAGILERLGLPQIPLLGFYGGRDEYISRAEIDEVVAAHEDSFVVYDDAEHGFFRDGSSSYDAGAAADAWLRMSSFFDAWL